MDTYILVYAETDCEPHVETVLRDQLEARIKQLGLTRWDYAIIKGEVVKNFASQLDLKRL